MVANVCALPHEYWRVVKEIHFDYQFGHTWATARVVYLRSLNENYNLNSEAGNNVAPFDDLDKLILDALTKKYENVIVKDWLLVCNSHIERLNNNRNAALEVNTVIAGTDLSLLNFFEQISIQNTDAIRFPLEVYVYNQATQH